MQVGRTNRRAFIAGLGSAAAWPVVTRGEQLKMPTIGVLVRAAPGWQLFWQLFPQDLRELGYVEGNDIRFEFRSDQGEMGRLPELAAELVRLKVDVIVAWLTPPQLPQRKQRAKSRSSVRFAETWLEPG
jgi:putative ABC transport system substrate-binding protein